jgi:light-regulated signal transduction histidine kinase (bacteriophytochrome)
MNFIDDCEQEKLHLSGKIQAHGALIVTDLAGVITHYSENIDEWGLFQESAQLGEQVPAVLTSLLELHADSVGKHHTSQITSVKHEVYYVVSSRIETSHCFEFYPSLPLTSQVVDEINLPATFNNESEHGYYREQVLKFIADITGHDRVMYYQFMENNDGVVTSEVCNDKAVGTYLDLRFPASDIPQIARDLYVKNPWRNIPSSQADTVDVLGREDRPDLSYVDLRSVSPVHQIYMKNMGVASSVSFPVIKNDKLDALVSCHSSEPKLLDRAQLETISSLVSRYALLARELESRERLALTDEFNDKTQHFRSLLNADGDIDAKWDVLADMLRREFEVDSIVLCSDAYSYIYGVDVDFDVISKIDHWYMQSKDIVFQTDHIKPVIDNLPLTEVAGFSGLKFKVGNNQIRLYLMRLEFLYEVAWGGNPNKPVETQDGGIAISPRQSFSKWVEKKLGYSKPWAPHTYLQLHRLRDIFESSSTF